MEQNEIILEIFSNVYNAIPILQALGDKERLFILLKLIYAGPDGISVKNLAHNSWLSRPAISHHLKVLKDAKIITSRKEGTMIYYYFDPSDKMEYVQNLTNKLQQHLKELNFNALDHTPENLETIISKAVEFTK